MKNPRFRIVWLMVAVALVALNFAAVRALLEFNSSAAASLILGALPMANVLVIGILIAQRHPGSRLFLLGFEVFGAMALAVYVALSVYHDAVAVTAYLELFMGPWEVTINRLPPPDDVISNFIVGVLLALPQVVFALIGGFLSLKYRLTLTRRPA
jgi:hypothetical protein